MHKISICKFLILMTVVTSSFGRDVVGRKTDRDFIKVTLNKEQDGIKFDLCRIKDPTKCLPIGDVINGKSVFYSVSDLEAQRDIEGWQVIGATVGDALAIAGIIGGGEILLSTSASSLSLSLSAIEYLIGGPASFILAVVKGKSLINAINPTEQIRQYAILRDEIIKDENVTTGRDIYMAAESLDVVLKKLRPL